MVSPRRRASCWSSLISVEFLAFDLGTCIYVFGGASGYRRFFSRTFGIVLNGERIDFVLTHSWHDDPFISSRSCSRLRCVTLYIWLHWLLFPGGHFLALVYEFPGCRCYSVYADIDDWREPPRSPSFWFDKVCIDQTPIADGIRTLPLSLMACSKVLVLLGTSTVLACGVPLDSPLFFVGMRDSASCRLRSRCPTFLVV